MNSFDHLWYLSQWLRSDKACTNWLQHGPFMGWKIRVRRYCNFCFINLILIAIWIVQFGHMEVTLGSWLLVGSHAFYLNSYDKQNWVPAEVNSHSVCRWGKWSLKRISNLPKTTQLVTDLNHLFDFIVVINVEQWSQMEQLRQWFFTIDFSSLSFSYLFHLLWEPGLYSPGFERPTGYP